MKFPNKKFTQILALLFLASTVQSQKSSGRLIYSLTTESKKIDTKIDTDAVNLRIVVRSSKKGYLENLTAKNFEIYDGTLQKVEFLTFDKSTNKYNVVYLPEISRLNKKRREVKLKIKLSADEKKEYGKITVNRQKWLLINRK